MDNAWDDFERSTLILPRTPDSQTHHRRTLALHMRGTDKSHGRRRIDLIEFIDPVSDFLSTFGQGAAVFLATDTASLANGMISHFASMAISGEGSIHLSSESKGTNEGDRRLYLRSIKTRSQSDTTPNFLTFDKMMVAEDVLIDIQLMARCDYFIYAASAVAEAVFYTNPFLQNRSANLEYKNKTARKWPWKMLSTRDKEQ